MTEEVKPPSPSRDVAEHLCVVIGRTRHKMMMAEIDQAAKRGARFIELRLDYLSKAPDFKRLLQDKPCAMLATVRRPPEGGRWRQGEDARQMLLRQCIVGGFDWVDLETDIADKVPRFGAVKRIVSYHNMLEVPKDLEAIHERMCKQDADVVKIAVRAQQAADNVRVLQLVKKGPRPTVAFCMGDLGMPSRLLGAKFGAPFAYAAFNKERGIAPGLPSMEEMLRVHRYERINAETRVFGLIGDPVGHSLSPLVHNTAFKRLGINATYVPFRVPRDELAPCVKAFEAVPVEGYSVTLPHKEQAALLARLKDSQVAQTQSANTLLLQADGTFAAHNTDFCGALDALAAHLAKVQDGPPTLSGRVVLVLGAGGVARSVAHALHKEGALVNIANRTHERAHKLAEEIGCRALDWEARHSVTSAEVVINCTPVGMHPNVDESPLHPSYLRPGLIVFDTVYNPETTLLVREARGRNCHVLTGVDFFVRQAAAQFKLFVGQEPPLEAMYKVVKQALSPISVRDPDEG